MRDALFRIAPCLRPINEIANAYKHCVRGRWDGKEGVFVPAQGKHHAKDLGWTEVCFRVGMRVGRPVVEHDFTFESVDNETVVGDAFRFWHAHIDSENDRLHHEIAKELEVNG